MSYTLEQLRSSLDPKTFTAVKHQLKGSDPFRGVVQDNTYTPKTPLRKRVKAWMELRGERVWAAILGVHAIVVVASGVYKHAYLPNWSWYDLPFVALLFAFLFAFLALIGTVISTQESLFHPKVLLVQKAFGRSLPLVFAWYILAISFNREPTDPIPESLYQVVNVECSRPLKLTCGEKAHILYQGPLQ